MLSATARHTIEVSHNSGTSVTPANGQVRKTIESGLHSVARATNAALTMCSVLCGDLFRKGQMPTAHFPVNIIHFLQRWCFHPAEIEGKKGQSITDYILV